MAVYRGPKCRLCRREGKKLFLKGQRCLKKSCAIERRNFPPGQHGTRQRKLSDYGVQLREKQKVRRIYGILERQFRNYYMKAAGIPGVTGTNLLVLLERRLDNMVYRMGFAISRNQARQLVLHGHFEVNGRKVNVPSYSVRAGDVVAVKQKSKECKPIKFAMEATKHGKLPDWLQVDSDKAAGVMIHYPAREEIPIEANEQLIVELYSK